MECLYSDNNFRALSLSLPLSLSDEVRLIRSAYGTSLSGSIGGAFPPTQCG